MLGERLKSASILISGMVLVLWLEMKSGGWVRGVILFPLALGAAILTSLEMVRLVQRGGLQVRLGSAVGGVVLAMLVTATPMFAEMVGVAQDQQRLLGSSTWLAIGVFAGAALAVLWEVFTYTSESQSLSEKGSDPLQRAPKTSEIDLPPKGQAPFRIGSHAGLQGLISSLGVILYVALPFGFLVMLHREGPSARWGLSAVIALLMATKAGDTGAYFVGRSLGRNKLAPALSPGKTWEGLCGGIGFSIAVAYWAFYWLFPKCGAPLENVPWWGPPCFGAVCALGGVFGDLCESLFKRDAGVKDSGAVLPGMGGIWDVTDSLLGAAVPGYLCFLFGAAGPWAS